MKNLENKKALAEAIAQEYSVFFPNSAVDVSKGVLGDGVVVECYLGNGKTFTNGISQNDPLDHAYWIYESEKGFEVTCDGIRLLVAPDENSYLAYDSVKIPFRKKKGDKSKIVKAMSKHFEKVRQAIDDNKNKLTEAHLKALESENIFVTPKLSTPLK